MRKLFTLVSIILFQVMSTFAQIGINTDGSQPDPSAMLDVKSNLKGMLPPRMTHSELNAISNAADGLIVYCTDCGPAATGAFFIRISGAWSSVVTCNPSSTPVAGIHLPSINQIIWKWESVPDASGYRWNTLNDFSSAIDNAANTSKTETGLTCNTSYTRYVWAYNTCGISAPSTLTQTTLTDSPAAPGQGVHVPLPTQIVWNWNTVSGATGYKWSATNNYALATDMGTNTSKTETGLTCNTGCTRYVWAYASCGVSNPTTLTQITSACWSCGQSITDSRNNKTYNTVLIGSQCWMKENLNIGLMVLGAQEQTDNGVIQKYCYNDLESNCDIYGGLYQWGELVQYLNGATNFTSWNPVPTGNIPGLCPSGWHIPTDAEWTQVATFLGGESIVGGKMKETGYSHWQSPNTDASNSSGFTALGAGHRETGIFISYLQYINFWSSTEYSNVYAWSRAIGYIAGNLWRDANYEKTKGFSVRCVKDQ
ncbi:MAG: hypothetical protein M0Q38_08170 [Bacteroidales bacterium]|jgi:uncharacterized protein (TIGR02145 family)|nr:hypothetical protein [Bacteroidales bacterium]